MNALAAMLTAALLSAGYVMPEADTPPLPPAQEARVQQLGKILRCAVCQGMSIADSPAPMARAQLDKVRSLVSEGKSDKEIRDYFVARYGEWVLLSPPAHGFNWVVWLAPGVLILVGAALIVKTVGKKAPSDNQPPPQPPAAGSRSGPADPYLDAVRGDLDS